MGVKIKSAKPLNCCAVKRLTEESFQSAAKELGVEPAVIKAVCDIEAPKGGFLPDGRVTILFERHKFHQYTHGIYSKEHPDISNPRAGGYGPAGIHQWDRFDRAAELDSEAAMEATSWGKFQIMGSNFGSAGYQSVGEFVDAMKVSEDEQLKAFISIVRSFGLVDELRNHNWAGFARGYNGANYAINEYDKKLKAAYLKHKNEVVTLTEETPSGSTVTVSTKVESSDNSKTQPPPQEITPATATVVTASQPSLKSKIVAFAHWIVAGLTGIGIGIDAIWNKVLGFASDHTVFLILIMFIGVLVIVGAWVYDRSMQRAQERTLKAADLAGAQDKNNIFFAGAK